MKIENKHAVLFVKKESRDSKVGPIGDSKEGG